MLVTDRELFGTVRVRRPRALRRVVPKDLLERLQPGDMVVHVDHGIVAYAGLVRRSAGGDGAEERDFLELHFAGTDRIWVPVEQIERVTRYAGGENPQLSRLGGGEWQRARTRVRKAVSDLAKELLELYAARATAHGQAVRRGHALAVGDGGAPSRTRRPPTSCASAWRSRPTWSARRPMDRLVVGDVGYGKTEVALRAAFKAIQDGMQVAVLVPTTVLAAQHLRHVQPAVRGVPDHGPDAAAGSCRRPSSRRPSRGSRRARWTWSSGTHRLLSQGHPVPGPGPRRSWTRSSASASPTRSGSSSSGPRSTC